MLVLSRKVGQRLVIGDGITVVVKRIAGQRVTLGIEAPNTVKIIRGELPSFATAAVIPPLHEVTGMNQVEMASLPIKPR